MIDYTKFDVMLFDEIIAKVDLKPSKGDSPYVINYIKDLTNNFLQI